MRIIEETSPNTFETVKDSVRHSRKVMWYAVKRTGTTVLVAAAAIVVVKAAFDMAVDHEVNKQISQ